MPRAKGIKCRHCDKHCQSGQEYCGNHAVQCQATGCTARLRAGSKFCVAHLDFERVPCRAEGCSKLAAPGNLYCGNHSDPCRTEGCDRRTREGGYCTVCKERNSKLPDANPKRTAAGQNRRAISRQLEHLIRCYEEVQGESSVRGQIAQMRLPVLRVQFITVLEGVR